MHNLSLNWTFLSGLRLVLACALEPTEDHRDTRFLMCWHVQVSQVTETNTLSTPAPHSFLSARISKLCSSKLSLFSRWGLLSTVPRISQLFPRRKKGRFCNFPMSRGYRSTKTIPELVCEKAWAERLMFLCKEKIWGRMWALDSQKLQWLLFHHAGQRLCV